MDIELAKKVAISAAKEAGKLVGENFQKTKKMSFKGENDMVTEIDLQSEKIILDAIKVNFPDHNILSEEAGATDNGSKYMWMVDPIDGTVNYYYGLDPYCIGICLLEDGRPILNVLYNPTHDEMYVAQKGKGAFMNEKRITVSDNTDLKNSMVMLNLSRTKGTRTKTLKIVERISDHVRRMRVFGSSLSYMSYISSGKSDAFFDILLKPWDFLPGALLVEEAGGKVTDIKGNEITADSTSVVASNGRVHDQILKLLENI
ncbi:MAG: inositol monophosphatase [Candidatus Staskawiczbacteria bacterium]|nr:inositol monophosphatase [Candidatus Staskawiczbacteria bacterium]